MSRRRTRGFRPDRLAAAVAGRQVDVARRAGISRQTLHNWLSGATTPQADRLARVAEVLGIGLVEFFDVAPDQMMLSDLRVQAGLTQPQLAARMHVSHDVVQQVELGVAQLSERNASAFAAALGVPVATVRAAADRTRNRDFGAAP